MISRERIVNKLRESGFKFKRDAWRVSIWKRQIQRVEVPKRDLIEVEWVRNAFRQIGMPREEIEAFIRATTN